MTESEHLPDGSEPVRGVAVIEAALATMPLSPGVYRMLDAKGDALYVGKARSLKKRVASYTQMARLSERLWRMVSDTASMEVVTTHTEAEALLLEANLIKRLKPRYNIVLRDDKSYPWLMLTEDHGFPQIAKFRGTQNPKRSYWGPFASAWAVNQTVTAMQRVFLLRSCADTVFANRSRPCPAAPDPPLLRTLCRPHRRRGLCRAGRAGQGVPGRQGGRRAAGAGSRDGGGRREARIREGGRRCATGYAR